MESDRRHILIPLDATSEGETALGAIDPLLRAGPVKATLLYVAEKSQPAGTPRAYLSEVCERLRAKGVEADFELRPGDPVKEIVASSRENSVDVIAMSPHRRAAIARLFAGSVTEQLIRRADVPVLSCPAGIAGSGWNRILVPLDGTELSEEILPDATSLARRLNAKVDVMKVAVPIVAAGDGGWVPIQAAAENPLPYLKSICARLESERIEARPVAASGYVAPEVLRFARESGAGLICMATYGRTGCARLMAGSVTVDVLRKAPCPVFVRHILAVAKPAPAHAASR